MATCQITGRETQVYVKIQGETRWFTVRYFGGSNHERKFVCLSSNVVVPVRAILNGK